MPRSLPLAEQAVEAQVAIGALRRAIAPLWEAALATGDWTVMAEAKALATSIQIAAVQARRIAGRADALGCPDDILEPGHGAAA